MVTKYKTSKRFLLSDLIKTDEFNEWRNLLKRANFIKFLSFYLFSSTYQLYYFTYLSYFFVFFVNSISIYLEA